MRQEMAMRTYQIYSSDGVDYGMWQGETPAEALLAMHRDAGYTDQEVWLEQGRLAFAPAPECGDGTGTYEALLGDVDAYTIRLV